MFGTRLQIAIKWKDAKGLCTIVIRLKWTGIVSWICHKLLMHVCKDVALSNALFNSYPALSLLSCLSILTQGSSLQYWTQIVGACFREILIPRQEIKLCFFPNTGLAGKTPATGRGHNLLVFLTPSPLSLVLPARQYFFFSFKESHSTYHQVLPSTREDLKAFSTHSHLFIIFSYNSPSDFSSEIRLTLKYIYALFISDCS